MTTVHTLVEFLAAPDKYTQADLHGKNITDADCQQIAVALRSANQLTELYLYQNQIGDAGARALGQGLAANTSLYALFLDNNQIGDAGAMAIAESLKSNKPSLIYLSFQINYIGEATVAQIKNMLLHVERINSSYQRLPKQKQGHGLVSL